MAVTGLFLDALLYVLADVSHDRGDLFCGQLVSKGGHFFRLACAFAVVDGFDKLRLGVVQSVAAGERYAFVGSFAARTMTGRTIGTVYLGRCNASIDVGSCKLRYGEVRAISTKLDLDTITDSHAIQHRGFSDGDRHFHRFHITGNFLVIDRQFLRRRVDRGDDAACSVR